MTARNAATALAILIGAIVLAACGPAAPAGTQAAGVTQAPATQAPGATAGPGVTFDLPNEDVELEALLPDQIGGDTVEKLSMTGESFLGGGDSGSEDFLAILGQFGKSPSDLSVAFGATTGDTTGNVNVQVSAFRVRGVDANQLFQAFLQVVGNAQGDVVSDASFGGKSVKKIVSVEGDTSYLYASGDVLFTVDATDDIAPELLNETFSKLR